MNPRIQSGLIETPSPASTNDAPRAGTVLVVGAAGSGPTTPVEFERAAEAYELYGNEGTLARDIELALLGATYGASAAGTGVFGRVVGLRAETGTRSSVVLTDSSDNTVMRLEAAEASEASNGWKFYETTSGFRIYDPANDEYVDIAVDKTGVGIGNAIASPTELAAAIRTVFENRLRTEVTTGDDHWEVSIDDTTSLIDLTTDSKKTSVDFDALNTTEMAALEPDSFTWLDSVPAYFAGSDPETIQTRILSESNEDARFYAITAGGPVEAPAGTTTVNIAKLADAKRIGNGSTNSLLNIRTTGVGSGTALTIKNAGTRGVDKVSEAYFRARQDYIGRFDPSTTSTHFWTTADVTADAAGTADFDLSTLPLATITLDGVALAVGDVVLLKDQTTPSENGYYDVVDNAGDLDFTLDTAASAWAGDIIEVSAGTVNAGKRFEYDSDNTEVDEVAGNTVIEMTFDADYGIADNGAVMSQTYAVEMGDTIAEADIYSTDRLGDQFEYVPLALQSNPPLKKWLKLELKGVLPGSTIVPIDLNFDGGADGIKANLSYALGTATLMIDLAEFEAEHGTGYDDGEVYVSYDSCVFNLVEKTNITNLDNSSTSLEYVVTGTKVTFNKALDHALVIRPLTITQYRLGDDVVIDRTSTGNTFIFHGEDNQPGEAGGAIGKMEVILGFDYKYESNFPTVASSTGVQFSGGSNGANADIETKLAAIEAALAEYNDQSYFILVPSGIYVDDVKTDYDPIDGTKISTNAGLIASMQKHQDRVSTGGASGIVYTSVKPMVASTSTGRYTDAQKIARFKELSEIDASRPNALATTLSGVSYPDFFILDAPMAVTVAGVTTVADGAPFFAGLRSTLPITRALYQTDLPQQISPLYRYDLPDLYMPGFLADARVNVWGNRRGEVRLADERTAAGLVADTRGRLVPSGFQSGISLLSAKVFLQDAVLQLQNLLGPVAQGGVDTLRETAVTLINGAANRTPGVQSINLVPQRDIIIRAEGGNSLGMFIKVFLQVNGELRLIQIEVGTVSEATTTAQATVNAIPIA